jgi:phosphatidylglycerophosphate synthase
MRGGTGTVPGAGLLRAIPNALTVSRMGLAVAFPWIPEGSRTGLLSVALATEFLDGFLARRFGWASRSGQLLDPIADKLLFAVVVGVFLAEERLTWLELAAVSVREAGVLIGVTWIAVHGRWKYFHAMKAERLGKITTALQYAVFFVVAFGHPIPLPLLVATFLAGLGAALHYWREFVKDLASG